MAIETQPDQAVNPDFVAALKVGEAVTRLTLVGSPTSDLVEATVMMGVIAEHGGDDDDVVTFDATFPGEPVVYCSMIAFTSAMTSYHALTLGLLNEAKEQFADNTHFDHHQKLLLRRPAYGEQDIRQSVLDLMDNDWFRDRNHAWMASFVDLDNGIANVSRALFEATGYPELDSLQTTTERTHPQGRAMLLSLALMRAIDSRMNMPRTRS
jgi:hypothetical protein